MQGNTRAVNRRGMEGIGEEPQIRLANHSKYFLVGITINPKDLTKMKKLLVDVLIIINVKGSKGKSFEGFYFLERVVLQKIIEVKFGVGGFMEDSMRKGDIRFRRE